VLVAIGVMVNVLSAGWYARYDATKNERHTLSAGSSRLVSELKSPLQADVYVTRGLAQLDAFVQDLTDLMKEYERAGGGKFQFTIIEANTDELRKKAEEEGLKGAAFGQPGAEQESDKIELAQGYMGIVLKYGSEKGVIPQLQPSRADGLEFWITNKIREIRDKADNNKQKIGVITDKDELKLTDPNLVPRQGQGQSFSLKGILQNALPFYTVEEVDLKGGEQAIDKSFDGILITQPRKEYTEQELRRIDEFLMLGNKSLAVFASAVTLKPQDPEMKGELSLHGLDKLLTGYGLDLKKNAVFDYGASFQMMVGINQAIRHPGIAIVEDDPGYSGDQQRLDTSFPGFFRMDQLVFPYPSSIELLRDKQPADVTMKVIARTTEQATVSTEPTVDMKLRRNWQPKPPAEQRIIAATVEGKLKSAFGKKDDKIKPNDRAPEPSRVLLVASAQFLTNPFAWSGNGPELGGQFAMFGGVGGDQTLQAIGDAYARGYLTATILALKNTFDWMSGDSDLIAASAKLLGEPALTYSGIAKPKIAAGDDQESIRKKDEEYRQARGRTQNSVQWTLTLGVPLFFALLGVLRWQWKNAQKSKKRI
jgi:ABC-type uncharacterized transport system involved in gliding motility auxiliary subunit